MLALLGGLLFVKIDAHRHCGVGVYRAVAFLDVLHDAILVDHNVRALRPLKRFVLHVVAFQDAVLLQHLFVHIAEQWELDIDLLCEGGVCGRTIHAYAEDFRVRGVDLTGAYSRLDRLELLRSTTGESQDVNRQQDIFLPAIVAQLNRFPLIAEQGEIRSGVADLQSDLGNFRFLVLRW